MCIRDSVKRETDRQRDIETFMRQTGHVFGADSYLKRTSVTPACSWPAQYSVICDVVLTDNQPTADVFRFKTKRHSKKQKPGHSYSHLLHASGAVVARCSD